MHHLKIHSVGEIRTVGFETGTSLLEILRSNGVQVMAACGGNGTCGKCKVKVKDVGMVTSCLYFPGHDEEVFLPRSLESKVLTDQHDYTLSIELEPGDLIEKSEHPVGVAIDVGTTSIAMYFIDLNNGHTLGIAGTMNSQGQYGADVISRINYCSHKPDKLKDLQAAVLNDIRSLIQKECESHKRKLTDIVKVSVAANTTMLHMLLGEDPTAIALAPFTPKFIDAKILPASKLELGLNPAAKVHVLPSISAYVGADVVAGLAAIDPPESIKNYLFVDIGTNGEMAIVTPDKIWTCATAAGPAFEGANISCGMGAYAGAISSFSKDDVVTINDEKAIGICGSGLLEAVAYLLDNEIVSMEGNLEEDFVLVDANKSGTGDAVALTPKDIREVQLAKSAISCGIIALTEKAGLSYDEVDALFVAGGFGNYMNIESAIRIGLLPQEMKGKVIQIGNTAGAGAVLDVCSEKFAKRLNEVVKKSEHFDLADDPNFAMNFAMGMYFS